MSITVATPNGGVAEFPDGTSPDAMRNALRAKFGSGPAKTVAQDISKMGAADVAKSAIQHVPESAANLVKDTVQAVVHPIDTATNIGKIGEGVLQKLGIMSGDDAKPYADAVGKFLVDRYGSGEAIKKTIATDPVGMAADIATVLSGGEATLARAPGVVGKLGEVSGAVGRAVDPLTLAGKATVGGGKLAAEGLGVTTGAGSDAIKIAAQAGAEGGDAGKAFRESMSGATPADAIVAEAKGAVNNLRKERGDIYRKDMAKIGADNTVLDFDKIDTAVQKAAGVKSYKGQSISPKTAGIRQEITEAVEDWKNLDPAEFHTAEGLDALKQKIGDIRDATEHGTPSRVVADNVYNAVKATIVEQAPDYAKVMKGYQEASDQIKEIERTLSVNPKASIDTALRKIMSSLRDNVNTNYGKRKELVAFLARSGATHLLQRIAGKTLSAAAPRGLARSLAGGEGVGALTAALAGHPAVAAGLGAGLAASSPALVGGAAYAAGAASRLPLRRGLQASRLIGAAGQ
jgi:hypothetical protein